MSDLTTMLILLGFIFLIGLAAETLGRHTPIPRVTLLIIAGVLLGPSVLGWLDPAGTEWFNLLSQVALTMVGFLLGGHLTRRGLQRHGRKVMALSLMVVSTTALLVSGATWLLTHDLALALLLGALATATAPAATTDVIRELGSKTGFSETLLGVVAVDDVWGVLIFSLMLAAAAMLDGGNGTHALMHGGRDIGGAILLGLLLGVPAAYITGRVSPGDPTLAEALGLVFLCLGLARWFEVSFLLSAVVMGMVIANLAHHHNRPFHAIENIQWPFMLVFFLFAGAALHLNALVAVGWIGAVYIGIRIIGRLSGAAAGAGLCGMSRRSGLWMGAALLPQAGVAVGMALVAAEQFPARAEIILPVILGATVVFELIGPPLARLALKHNTDQP